MKLSQQIHDKIKRRMFHERFWPLYPLKVGKLDAEKAWVKVIETQQDVDTCLANTPQWARHWDPAFQPYPATYLRKGYWQSPPPDSKGKRGAPRQQCSDAEIEEAGRLNRLEAERWGDLEL